MQEHQQINPDQAREVFVGLVEEILEKTRQGATFFEPEVHASIRQRVDKVRQFIQPHRERMVADLCAAVKDRKRTLDEAKALVTHIFGGKRRNRLLFQQLDLAQVELGITLDLEAEKVLQLRRRSIADGELVMMYNRFLQPKELEAEMARLCEEEAYWLKALNSINSGTLHEGVLDAVRNVRIEADTLEAVIEDIKAEIVELNHEIRQLKAEARRADDERVIEIATIAVELDARRNHLRTKLEKKKEGLYQINHAWLLSKEQQLEHEGERVITALEAILSRAGQISELLKDPPEDMQVSEVEVDVLNLQAEAYMNVALRLHEKASKRGLPKYKREYLGLRARQLEDDCIVWEV